MHACINKNNSWAFCMSKESIDDFFKIHKPRHNKFVFMCCKNKEKELI